MDQRTVPLSTKDAQAFKEALKLYEKKEYLPCLAEVEAILKRRKEHPHGESLCLKALLYQLLKRDGAEAERWMKEGTQIDAKSHAAWHMAGIYYKLRKDFKESYHAYLTSYQLNSTNSNVYQDLAMLAAQMRDYPTLVDIRRQILSTQMSTRQAWTALAAAQYLNSDFAGVIQTVGLYDRVIGMEAANLAKTKPKKSGKAAKNEAAAPLTGTPEQIEVSEMLMLRTRALVAQQKFAEALRDLVANEPRVLDKLAWQEAKADALLHTDKPKGRDAYLQLLKRNPEQRQYYEQLESAEPQWAKLYADLQARFPKSDLAFGRPLALFGVREGQDHYDPQWQQHFWQYLHQKLARGAPAAFKLVQPLYADADKREAISAVISEHLGAKPVEELSVAELVYLARHLAATNAVNEGLQLLETALSTRSTEFDAESVVDLRLAHADLQQQVGALQTAADEWAKLAEANPGDRALNTGAAAAYYRAGDVEHGDEQAYTFPIRGKYAVTHEEALTYISGVESVNVILAMAEGHARRRDFGMALKRALLVLSTYQQYYDELYDFHYYGPRRATLRAYIDTVHWENTIFTTPTYLRALEIAVDQWIHVARNENDGLTDKQRTAAKRQRTAKLERLEMEGDGDKDPFGLDALHNKNSLTEAYDLWQKVERAQPSVSVAARSHWIGFRILLAQKKYLLANQCLKRAKEAGISESRLAAGGLMARYTLETDEQAPQVLRSMQLKLLPSVVSMGDIVNADPVEYANEHVTDLCDWIRVRRYINALDGVEPKVIERLQPVKSSAAEAEEACLILQREPGHCEQLAAAIKQQWPQQTFIST